jgi:hypothetical protein
MFNLRQEYWYPGKQKRAVYATLMEDTDPDPLPEDNLGGEYEVFMVDTDINDIMAYNSNMNRMGPARSDSEMKTKYLPREEWNKLSQAQKDTLLEKRCKERSGWNNQSMNPNTCQVNAHHVEELINIHDLIDYTIMSHKIDSTDVGNDTKNSDDLLALPSRMLVIFVRFLMLSRRQRRTRIVRRMKLLRFQVQFKSEITLTV